MSGPEPEPDPYGDRLWGWSLAAAALVSLAAAVFLIIRGG